MFYLGIDQHRKQLTVNLRNEAGDVVLRRQVSTDWRKAREFLAQLAAQTSGDGGYVTIVEVCGFNDWLLKLLAGELKGRGLVTEVCIETVRRALKKARAAKPD